MAYKIKNWEKFQHYKNRNPPWIKLHKSLLDDIEFLRLDVASRALAPLIWLLASEHDNGIIKMSIDDIAYRLRLNKTEIEKGIKGLNAISYIECYQDASNMLACCKQDATLEVEVEVEVEVEKEDISFDQFWESYDKKVGKEKTLAKWERLSEKDRIECLAAVPAYVKSTPDKGYRKNPLTYLNGRHWEDEIIIREKNQNAYGRPGDNRTARTAQERSRHSNEPKPVTGQKLD